MPSDRCQSDTNLAEKVLDWCLIEVYVKVSVIWDITSLQMNYGAYDGKIGGRKMTVP